MSDAYDEARAKLQAQAERQGFEPTPQALEAAAGPRCPVGYCHPGTAQSLRASHSGLCARHWRKISGPLQHQLEGATKRGEDAAAGMLEQAVLEARRQDGKWHPFAVIVGEVVQPFDSHEQAVKRHHELALEGKLVALQSSKRGLLTAHQIRAYSPHEVIDGAGVTIASAKTLAKAIGEAHRKYHDEGTGSPTWPKCQRCDGKGHFWWDGEDTHPPGEVECPDCQGSGRPAPTVVNSWTGEELAWGLACEAAARGHMPKTRPDKDPT